jgi:hypothetical protein
MKGKIPIGIAYNGDITVIFRILQRNVMCVIMSKIPGNKRESLKNDIIIDRNIKDNNDNNRVEGK